MRSLRALFFGHVHKPFDSTLHARKLEVAKIVRRLTPDDVREIEADVGSLGEVWHSYFAALRFAIAEGDVGTETILATQADADARLTLEEKGLLVWAHARMSLMSLEMLMEGS